MSFISVWLCTMALAAPPHGISPVGMGVQPKRAGKPHIGPSLRKMLKTGSAQAQIIAWRQEIQANPDSEEAHISLGKALTKQGDCTAALDELWAWSDAPSFAQQGATSAALCSARLGLYTDALAFDRMALEADPESVHAYTLLALHADRLGDQAQVDEALDALGALGTKGGDPTLYTRAVLALRSGDLNEFDIDCALWVRSGWDARELMRLEAQLWMDLDDPQSAMNIVSGKLLSIQDGRHIFLEAQRRLGEAGTVFSLLDNQKFRVLNGVGPDALRIRTRADLGEFEEAHHLLQDYGNSTDPDIVSAGWYLARAEGNKDEMQRLSQIWDQVRESPLRHLEQLIPVNQRK